VKINNGLLIQAGNYTIVRNVQNGLPVSVSGGSLSLSRTFNGYAEISAQNTAISGSSKYLWNVTRDNTGRITARTETIGGATTEYGYFYDPAGRLKQVTKDGVLVEEYGYENIPLGTRTYEMNLQRGLAGRTLVYDAEDRLLTAGTTTYQYDLDGFLSQKTNGSDPTYYDYSLRGELQSVTLPDGTVIEYVHDPLGRRIAKKINGALVEKYLWSSMTRLLAVYDGAGALKMRFEYADDRMPVSMVKDGTRYYLAYDPAGSLRLVTNASGAIIKQIDYDAFGCKINDTNPLFTVPFGFAGGLYDRDTGLVRFGYRDYDPAIGRWTAKDPIGFAGGDTDLYGYCLNDPVNMVDPLGLINWRAVGKGALATFGGGVSVVTGALASTTGAGAVGGVPAVIVGSAAVGWGVSQMITGSLDNEIPFMGTKEAVIKGTTEPGLLQDGLLGINSLGDMLLTGRTAPTDIGKINNVMQNGYSIYNSGSKIDGSLNGSDSSPCK